MTEWHAVLLDSMGWEKNPSTTRKTRENARTAPLVPVRSISPTCYNIGNGYNYGARPNPPVGISSGGPTRTGCLHSTHRSAVEKGGHGSKDPDKVEFRLVAAAMDHGVPPRSVERGETSDFACHCLARAVSVAFNAARVNCAAREGCVRCLLCALSWPCCNGPAAFRRLAGERHKHAPAARPICELPGLWQLL